MLGIKSPEDRKMGPLGATTSAFAVRGMEEFHLSWGRELPRGHSLWDRDEWEV